MRQAWELSCRHTVIDAVEKGITMAQSGVIDWVNGVHCESSSELKVHMDASAMTIPTKN